MRVCADRPGLPTDLVASALDDSLSVSWSRPSSSHPISHYSVDVWDTQTESLIANGTEITDLQYTLEYMAVGIDTCNRSYNVVISVCGVNVAGKGKTANTTMAIQQNMQSCPTTSGNIFGYNIVHNSLNCLCQIVVILICYRIKH